MVRVADYIISFLYSIGIHEIFVVTGGGSMYLNDALARHKKMRYVCQHHEQSCAIAADAYARATENIGAAMVTTGPGATNAITGVLSAWFDSIPMIVVSGQAKRKDASYNSGVSGLRQLGVQELNIIPIINSITKYSVMVNEPKKIRSVLEEARYIAMSGRPGPVWVDVPLDVQNALIDPETLERFLIPHTKNSKNETLLKQNVRGVINSLLHAKKPLFIAGNGIKCSHAQKVFIELIEMLHIPVVTSNMGVDLIDYDNPLNLGMGGIKGQRSANIAMQNADLLVSVGNRLSIPFIGYEYEKFAPQAKKIVIDIDRTDHKKKTIHIDKFILADAKEFIEELIQMSKNVSFSFKSDWAEKCSAIKYNYPVCLPAYANEKGDMNMYYVVNEITSHLNKSDVIVADAGSAYYVVAQALKIKLGQKLILPGGAANMGYNLPASVGASIGLHKKRVICITGDGSLQTNIHELQTIVSYKLPVKIFVFNNKGYLSIRNTQRNLFQNRKVGESEKTGLFFPDLKKISYAYGIKYILVKNKKDLNSALPKVVGSNKPIICDIQCLSEQEIIPSVLSKKLPDGSMVSLPIDDMYPFLPAGVMREIRRGFR